MCCSVVKKTGTVILCGFGVGVGMTVLSVKVTDHLMIWTIAPAFALTTCLAYHIKEQKVTSDMCRFVLSLRLYIHVHDEWWNVNVSYVKSLIKVIILVVAVF